MTSVRVCGMRRDEDSEVEPAEVQNGNDDEEEEGSVMARESSSRVRGRRREEEVSGRGRQCDGC